MNDISTLSDKFSWRRMISVGLMYKGTIKTYLLMSAAVSLAGILIVELAVQLGGNVIGVYTAMSFVVALALYLSPLIFTRRDDTLIGLLPVKAVEKWAFYVLFCFIVVPVVIQGTWYGVEYLAKALDLWESPTEVLLKKYNMTEVDIYSSDKFAIILVSIIQSAMIMVTVLYAVLGKREHRVMRGVLSFFGVLLMSGFISGIAGVVAAITEIEVNPDFIHHPEGLVNSMMPMFSAVYSVLAVYTIVMLYLCYRRIVREEIKA